MYSKRLSAKSSQVPEELNFGLHILILLRICIEAPEGWTKKKTGGTTFVL